MKANGIKRASGFTLIELMIVVAIIGILAAIAIPKFANLIRQSQEGSTKGNLGSIRSALSIYYGDQQGVYPCVSCSGSGAAEAAINSLTISGKYLAAVPASNVQPYHGSVTSAVDVNTETGGSPAPTDTGGWLYDSTLNGQNVGGVWVDCTHTDTKGTIWTAY